MTWRMFKNKEQARKFDEQKIVIKWEQIQIISRENDSERVNSFN